MVCPLVGESEALATSNTRAVDTYNWIDNLLEYIKKSGLVHEQTKIHSENKDIMQNFKDK